MDHYPQKKNYPNTIDNIPPGILSCSVRLMPSAVDKTNHFVPGAVSEVGHDLGNVTATEMSEAHICFRLPGNDERQSAEKNKEQNDDRNAKHRIMQGDTLLLSFRCFFWGKGYEAFGPFEACVVNTWAEEGMDGKALIVCAEIPETVEIAEVAESGYAQMVRCVETQLFHYITEKVSSLENADNSFSKNLVGYPSESDEVFSESLSEWQRKMETEKKIGELWGLLNRSVADRDKVANRDREYVEGKGEERIGKKLELALSLENPHIWNAYLEGVFPKEYIYKNKKMKQISFSRIYIGNAYCHNLFPSLKTLEKILEKAHREHAQITIVLTYLRESIIEKQRKMIDFVLQWAAGHGETIEFEINDLGWLEFFEERDSKSEMLGRTNADFESQEECGIEIIYTLTYGRLLNKRRKDPRHIYKDGWEEQAERLAENALNDETFVSFLKEYKVTGCEMESCGYKVKAPSGLRCSVHMPLYQTNMSQYCPLYALTEHGERGMQRFIDGCSMPCADHAILYPDHLGLVGLYNSIFAIDGRNSEEILSDLDGIDRVVWNWFPETEVTR